MPSSIRKPWRGTISMLDEGSYCLWKSLLYITIWCQKMTAQMLEVIKRRYVKGQLQFISISIDAVKVSPVIDMFLFTFGVIIYLMLTSLGSVEWNMLHFSISIYVPISSLIYHYYSTIFLSHFSLQLLLILISVVPKFFTFRFNLHTTFLVPC